MSERLDKAIDRTRAHLLGLQHPQGYWVGELESDVTVTAGYIPLLHFLGLRDPVRERKAACHVRCRQLPDGSWSLYPGGPGDLNVSIQAYFALKLAGVPTAELAPARDFILSHGGIPRAHTFTKILLALFGQYPWGQAPRLPPELILLPNWSYFNIYDFASWSRATIVALMVVMAQKPVAPVPESARLGELYPSSVNGHRPWRSFGLWGRGSSQACRQMYADSPLQRSYGLWGRGFLVLDRLAGAWERSPVKPGRGLALRKAEAWVLAHQEADGSWGGIMLPWVYSLIALRCRGYPLEHPALERGIRGLDAFIIEDATSLRLQPAVSPVWDTALAALALAEAGLGPAHPALVRARDWLLGQQVLAGGDWQVKNPRTPPGGWAFEFENDRYPDVDDTALVLLALDRLPEATGLDPARKRGVDWLLAMQSRDGGWAAFDRDNDKALLKEIPFADFMTPLDPTSPDVTAHAVELLGTLGYGPASSPVARGLAYLRKRQEADGSWSGRWGVNYTYGTGSVLLALRAAGEDMSQQCVLRAAGFLRERQNADGGWGETCQTYALPGTREPGPSTPSQTAWAVLGLLAAGEGASPAVQRGTGYLLGSQTPEGDWPEDAFTGTGFPRAFYLKYHLYRCYFPLLALARYRAFLTEHQGGAHA